jgi:hypothetical protein
MASSLRSALRATSAGTFRAPPVRKNSSVVWSAKVLITPKCNASRDTRQRFSGCITPIGRVLIAPGLSVALAEHRHRRRNAHRSRSLAYVMDRIRRGPGSSVFCFSVKGPHPSRCPARNVLCRGLTVDKVGGAQSAIHPPLNACHLSSADGDSLSHPLRPSALQYGTESGTIRRRPRIGFPAWPNAMRSLRKPSGIPPGSGSRSLASLPNAWDSSSAASVAVTGSIAIRVSERHCPSRTLGVRPSPTRLGSSSRS